MPGGVASVPMGIGIFSPVALKVPKNGQQPTLFSISGTTKDQTGAVLPLSTVMVFDTNTRNCVAVVTSDAAGLYTAGVPQVAGMTFFVVSYKAGSPDVAGTTLNTLTATVT